VSLLRTLRRTGQKRLGIFFDAAQKRQVCRVMSCLVRATGAFHSGPSALDYKHGVARRGRA
jgi:hypothetical protein